MSAVADTPFDLRTPRRLGDVVRTSHPQIERCRGLDHCFVPDGEGLRPVAVLRSARTATSMELSTDLPGLQVYTGNSLTGATVSGSHRLYRQGDGIALEPQYYPDSVHHPDWPSPRLDPGQTWSARIRWQFSQD
jgi:aldose 1-epimerase